MTNRFKINKEVVPHLIMVGIGFLTLVGCFLYLALCDCKNSVFSNLAGLIRVIVALSAACISIALPGFIELETQENKKASPTIKASGALAVFVLVYLFNPIN